MAARPPQNDEEEVPETLAFGISALDARLTEAEVTFPATESDLVESLGDADIPYDTAGHTLSLSAALEDVDQQRFENQSELQNALHPVYERKRRESGSSLIGQMRRLLPF